ncbi:MAG TPA: glycosyltransferase family 39 protein [Lacunisphaera sp.]|nr:glycosyltransferase family 39 protein [Lacunisphaera sp.]
MTPGLDSRPRWIVAAGVAALLLLHVGLALWAAAKESVTADELLHLTGGYFYNKYGDYRIQPENGNLPQRVAGLPAWLMGAPPPRLEDNIYWRTSDGSVVGHQFFYETGHDHWPMLMAGRALMTLFSVAIGVLVFCWSRRLFGTTAGFLSLTFYALSPNFLAHAALTTSDVPAVFFLLASLGAFWRHLAAPNWRNGLLSALLLGLACVAKYSAILLPPMMLALLAWRSRLDPLERRLRWWRIGALTTAGHALVAVGVIWAFYGFRYSGFAAGVPPADQYTVAWSGVLPYIGVHGRLVEFCRAWHLLPEAFLYGYAWVVQSAAARAAFLAGQHSIYGWVSFFPLAFLWKTPVAVLVALAAGVVVVARHRRKIRLATIAPLAVLFVGYWAISLASKLNIGHRHILPTYPVLFILIGGLAAPGVLTGLWRTVLPVLLVAGQLVANLRVAPHYLAFFNSFAGGPANGYRLLVDSSLDWGQDLPGLAAWLRDHNAGPAAQPVYLSYFGSGEPDYYHITATKLPFLNGFKIEHPWYEPGPGLYCISATILQQVYGTTGGAWNPEFEKEYQALRAREPYFREFSRNPEVRRDLERAGTSRAFEQSWQRYDGLRLARLTAYLRARRPVAVIGYSIFIYRLDAAEVNAAVNGPYSQWLMAIANARASD